MPTSLGEYSGKECTVYECVRARVQEECERVCVLILVAPRLNYLLTNLKNTLKSLRYGQAEITDKCARAPLCVCVCLQFIFAVYSYMTISRLCVYLSLYLQR